MAALNEENYLSETYQTLEYVLKDFYDIFSVFNISELQ
jgi:hypothetical protein